MAQCFLMSNLACSLHTRGRSLPLLGSRRIVGQQQCCRWRIGSSKKVKGARCDDDGFACLPPLRLAAREGRRLAGMAGRIESRLEGEDSKPSMRQETDGIIIVDHGSRRAESSAMLNQFVEMYKQRTAHAIVEPAHMELAEPTIAHAFDRCVEQGATRVVLSTYFLFPGKHWDRDIPALAAEAAKAHPLVPYVITAPIGLHDLMVDVIEDRMQYCLSHVAGEAKECEMCSGTGRCQQQAAGRADSQLVGDAPAKQLETLV